MSAQEDALFLSQLDELLGLEPSAPAAAPEVVPDLLGDIPGIEFPAPPVDPSLFAAPVAKEVELVVPDKPTTNIMEKAVCISLRIGRIGIKRKVSSSRIEVKQEDDKGAPVTQLSLVGDTPEEPEKKPAKKNDTDRRLLAVTKTLLDCQEHKDVLSFDGETRRWLASLALPSPFRAGTSLVSTEAVAKIEEQLNERAKKRLDLIAKFKTAYPVRVQETALRLGPLFSAEDYPPPERIDKFFKFEWQWVSFGTPEALKEISGSIFQREREKAEKRWAEAEVKIQQVLRANLAELVEHLRERLSGDEDGKTKRFQASTLNKVNDFLKTFSLRNVTNDDELEALVRKAGGLLNGVDADMLRSDDKAREIVRQGFVEIKATLDSMITSKPQRQIVFDEEEDGQ